MPFHADRARTVSTSTNSATVLWLGYQAPNSISTAVSGAVANHAAKDLQKFQTALQSRNPDQRKVVIGYSYGSTVAGKAASSSELDVRARHFRGDGYSIALNNAVEIKG
ncbi:cutinase family protein [Corynebacterium glutamicum]|uniref:alpha/beta hydrolase n=1 Tax=Corynebacterium glutamicum TaxID=1718 RepID=UPI0000165D7B|nr:alpha/beta hydrolase [Corynebacterium glutamicum]ARV64200.1 hypothetical protein B7P23_04460 [Corynebacterium glutamicum]AUI01172.1 cutinase family protein [Corynebacterium glutamicum]AUI04823.1 cutinase family protein [Corynebacterium glutamicum]MBA4570263.1 cutinase family protein [Corynebacterium glutamicum]MBA4572293.1 cutinase family protein [Corynebacterium glutamicum]